ncbi:hypothetical protein BCONGLO52_15270 [Brachybacterium conglomeratum]|uniref:Uncharacterized protein n=1 Tax=Brachybacterium conglomeratum TaxID=47846 RepID=A0ABQ5RH50_9MICO|nr:hypothetical protein BCONGLO52_15270 [Brachybacterium conglomeratum]GLK05200.1 hypothetical protein GCM10017597_20000 [Brachybacterium conglomeratum]
MALQVVDPIGVHAEEVRRQQLPLGRDVPRDLRLPHLLLEGEEELHVVGFHTLIVPLPPGVGAHRRHAGAAHRCRTDGFAMSKRDLAELLEAIRAYLAAQR